MKLQRYVLLFVSVLLASGTVQAQLVEAVGIKGGLTISNLRFQEPLSGNADDVVNPFVALFAKFLESEHFGLQADLIYQRKGASQTFKIPENPWDVERTLDYTTESGFQYLTLALAAQPKLPLGDDVALYAHLGPTANYMLTVHNYGTLQEFDRFQFGYTAGVGVDFLRVFNSHLFVEVLYTGDFQSFYQGLVYHRTWMLSLGTTL